MRITGVRASNVPPVQHFSVERLSDVVAIAGPNGVGKSRLIEGLLQKFQKPTSYPQIQITLEATCATEKNEWGKTTLDTAVDADAQSLIRTLQKTKSRRQWSNSVIHFESDRSIQQINPYTFSWDIIDPWLENIGWNHTFGGLRARFQDTIHSLFRKMQSHEKEIARKAIDLQKGGHAAMPLDFADPLKAFKDAFALLVAPKKLIDPDPREQNLHYEYGGRKFPLNSLSSGEREVVNIVFDFILRTPSDCIVFFDEPELHLHPELSYKLIQALRSAGSNNQFIFCTHSPDIITASLDQTVLFLSPPTVDATGTPANQAIRVEENDSTNQALKLLGQSIGIVALGKRVVLIEGTTSSLDKQTYGFLLKNRFPSLVLVPTGGKDMIRSFSPIVDNVLDKAIWGVEFFLLCDRDSADAQSIETLTSESKGRLRFLGRYHLENYFLDTTVIAGVFEKLEPEDSWLRHPAKIEAKLREIALKNIGYATALIVSARIRRQVGNVSVMAKGCHGKTADELVSLMTLRAREESERTQSILKNDTVEHLIRSKYTELSDSLQDPSEAWKTVIPGKQILSKFAAEAGIDSSRFKLAYLFQASNSGSPVFDEIISIFEHFALTRAEIPPNGNS